jgi:hypothetical protein
MTEPIRHLSMLALLGLAAGCSDSFPVYNELEGFRVLALRATPPAIREGESTTLDALVFVENGDLADVSYAWSYCPLRASSAAGGDCLVDEATFAEALGLPAEAVDFDLGTEPTATLNYPGSALAFRAACANQASSEQAAFFACDGGFPISVRAEVRHGEQTIVIQKEVKLVFDEADVAAPNQNPRIGAVSVEQGKTETPWEEGAPATLELGTKYKVYARVGEGQSEAFTPEPTEIEPSPEPQKEALYISWFVTSGETEYQRTSYLDGEVAIEKLEEIEWTLPKSGDEPARTARFYAVLRDERGGVDWISRDAELTP